MKLTELQGAEVLPQKQKVPINHITLADGNNEAVDALDKVEVKFNEFEIGKIILSELEKGGIPTYIGIAIAICQCPERWLKLVKEE